MLKSNALFLCHVYFHAHKYCSKVLTCAFDFSCLRPSRTKTGNRWGIMFCGCCLSVCMHNVGACVVLAYLAYVQHPGGGIEGGCIQGCPYALRPGPALSPMGTRLDSVVEVLPDAAAACDIVNELGRGACLGSLVYWHVCQFDAYTFLVSFKLVLIFLHKIGLHCPR